jgi:hypothetical protein
VKDHILFGYLNRKEFLPDPYAMTGKKVILMATMPMEYVQHYNMTYGTVDILFHTFITLGYMKVQSVLPLGYPTDRGLDGSWAFNGLLEDVTSKQKKNACCMAS